MAHEAVIETLGRLLGDRLSTAESQRAQHAQNEAYFPPALPDAVAYPETTEEVSQILRLCHAQHCPVTAFAAGSSLEGQHLPIAGGISLDMSRMNRVLSVNAEDLNCVVQPG